MIKNISIHGYRGFGEKQDISFALPSGDGGSGITFIVGGNNTGKTSVIEAIKAFNYNRNSKPTFSVGKRNERTGKRIFLELTDESDDVITINTVRDGGSATERSNEKAMHFYILQSRRYIDYEFDYNNGELDRDTYLMQHNILQSKRSYTLNAFFLRLFRILENKEQFDILLERILGGQGCLDD